MRWQRGRVGIRGDLASRIGEEILRSPDPSIPELRECLSALALEFVAKQAELRVPLPEYVLKLLKNKRIALVGFTAEGAEEPCDILEGVGARPRPV